MKRILLVSLPLLVVILSGVIPSASNAEDTIDEAVMNNQTILENYPYYADQIGISINRTPSNYDRVLEEYQLQSQYAQNSISESPVSPQSLVQSLQTSRLRIEEDERFYSEEKEAYEAAYGLVLDEDWKNAVDAFNTYTKNYTDSPWTDDAQFWLCYSEEKGGIKKPAEAFDCYQAFIDKFPTSNWADDAKTNMIRLARVLEQSGNTSYRVIVQEMQADEEEKLVLTAITALQNAGTDDTIEALADAYDKSDNRAARERIVYVLDRSQTQQAADKLMDIARNERSDDLRSMAVLALGRKIRRTIVLGGTRTANGSTNSIIFEGGLLTRTNSTADDIDVEEIARTLKDIAIEDKNSSIRNDAFVALANAPTEVALEFIIDTATSGDDYSIRRTAIEALGRSDDPRAREALIDIINSQK